MSVDPLMHSVGRVVGDYRLEEEIGRGGMGVVYRAIKLDTGETLALKLMLPEIAANQQFRARFVREASLGSGLDHPNIVPIYEAGEADGELFLAMRLVEGRDLKQLLEEEGRLDPRRMLAILRQVAGALDAAHEAGVVHHDIKPQNILVTEAEEGSSDLVYVTDFGLVKPAGSESTNSRTGAQVFGSIQYMPPEQVEGLPADGRADVYALGCVVFECLTGSIPFDRPNEVAVLWAHVHEQPSRVTDLRPELPNGLDEVVATAMAKRPDDRFLTCGELVEAFEQGLQRTARTLVMPIVKPLVKRVPRRKTEDEVWAPNYFPELSRVRKLTDKTNWLHVTAITSILCLLAAALVHFAHPRGLAGAVDAVATAVGDSVLSTGDRIGSAFSDEEGSIAGEGSALDGGIAPASDVAAGRDGASDRVPLSRDVPGEVASDVVGEPPSMSAELPSGSPPPLTGKILFESTRDTVGTCCDYGIYVMNADGSSLQTIYNDPVEDEHDPTWSPAGSHIAFTQGDSLFVMNADGSDRREVFGGGTVQDPAWSPDGTRIAFSRHAQTGVGPMDDGWDVWVANVDGSGARPLTGLRGFDRFPTWADDEIAFAAERAGNVDIYSSDSRGDDLRRITSAKSTEIMPEFGPGGTRIAYVVNRGGAFDIYTKRPGLQKRETRVSRTLAAFSPAWSPDGAWIAFSGGRAKGFAVWGENDIYLVPVGGGEPIRWTVDPPQAGGVSEAWDFNASWS